MLFRITPRPLATRAWRTCDMPGALNATIAAAIIDLTKPCADDLFLNPMCGSGSLMIERAAWGGAQAIGGCDINPDALECAAQNIAKANFSEQVEIFAMDATQLDLPDATFDVICADLPWGQLTGTHEENAQLYPLALTEWGRVAKSGARMVLITHEIALFEPLVTSIKDTWELRHSLKVFQGGLHPRIYVFRRM